MCMYIHRTGRRRSLAGRLAAQVGGSEVKCSNSNSLLNQGVVCSRGAHPEPQGCSLLLCLSACEHLLQLPSTQNRLFHWRRRGDGREGECWGPLLFGRVWRAHLAFPGWPSQAGLPRLAQNGAGEGSVSEPLPLCPFPLSFLCS